MFRRLIRFFRGNVTVYVPQTDKDAFLALLVSSDVSASTRPKDGDGGIHAELSLGCIKKLAPYLDKLKIKVYIISVEGCLVRLSALRYRLGTVLGAVLLVTLVWLSGLFVWRVDVVGADGVSANVLKLRLNEFGVGVGSRISDIDTLEIGDAFLIAYPELSWVSLDITGTTATLTVRETVLPDGVPKSEGQLIVASEAGVIESVLVYSGGAAVQPGSVVKKGDVLISGLISGSGLQYTPTPVLRIGNASGTVTAKVERSLSVSVPLEETVYTADGSSHLRRTLNILGKNFSFGAHRTDAECSETENRYNVTLFGIIELPIEVTETVWTEYTVSHITRTEDEAARRARKLISEMISSDIGDGETLWIKLTQTEHSGVCTVDATYSCIAEIGEVYRLGG